MIYVQGFFFQPKQVRLPHQEIPVPHNFRFRFLTIISFLNIFFLNMSTLIIYHELFNWHGGGYFNVYEITFIAKSNVIMVLHSSNCTIFDNEIIFYEILYNA